MIPFCTTHLTITRIERPVDTDPYDPDSDDPGETTIATGVRAVISTPSASNNLVAGDRIVYNARLTCDLCGLQADDTVTESDGTVWTCLWVRPSIGLGVDHLVAQLRFVTGAAA